MPLVAPSVDLTSDTFFNPQDGIISKALPGFIPREGQPDLSELIMAAKNTTGVHIIANAPTGFGKSFAALVPAIIRAVKEKKRTVISTETIALQDQYCLAPGTRVLTDDLRYIPIETLTPGTHLLGFDEERVGHRRDYHRTQVLSIEALQRPCYRLTLKDGRQIVSSSDHKWLCRRGPNVKWLSTESICPTKGKRHGSNIIDLVDTWDELNSSEIHYLRAAFDGEGHLSQHRSNQFDGVTNCLMFTQKENVMLAEFDRCAALLGFECGEPNRQECKQRRIVGGRREMLRALGLIRPLRLLNNFNPEFLGTLNTEVSQEVVKKEFLGDQTVIAIKTSTGTFIAEGLASHNCNKDLPFLQKACAAQGIHFTFAVAKGRTNYVCKNKLDDASFAGRANQLQRWAGLQQIDVNTGDRASVPFSITDMEWRDVGADDDCERKSCPFYGEGNKGHSDCFIFDAARKYKEAEIIVTNHTLFLLDAANKPGSLFGAYDMAIIDEGHTLPEHAQKVWGMEIRPRTVSKTLKLVDKMLRRAGVSHFESGFVDYWENMEDRLFLPFRRFHNHNSGNTSFYLKNISEYVEESKLVATEMIERLKDENKLLGQFTADQDGNDLIEAGRDKIYKLVTTLKRIFGDEIDPEHVDNWVTYLEICRNPNNNQKFCVLHLKPIDVAPLIRGLILDTVPNVTFMSATMKLGQGFGFMRAELGLPKEGTIEFVGKTPFNYFDNVEGYFPTDLPDPDAPDYIERLAKRIRTILIRRKGSGLILFTSNKTMQGVYEWIMERGCPHTCFMQGQGSKAHLLNEFKADITSCLFATRSFFAGIDVPGDALRTVIMVKYPFRVPSDPLFKAKCDKLQSKGFNAFSGYAMPLMQMDFLQAFGRGIRTTTDHMLFCCLDSKGNKKNYCSDIKRVLPKIRYVDIVDKVG